MKRLSIRFRGNGKTPKACTDCNPRRSARRAPLHVLPGLLGAVLISAAGATALVMAQAEQAPPRRPNQTAEFMQTKLPHVHKVIDALAMEDFEDLAQEAQTLELLTLEESWLVATTDDYRRHSTDFRRSLQDLREAAKTKNIHAATLAYVDMTFKCVKCHAHVRGLPVPQQ